MGVDEAGPGVGRHRASGEQGPARAEHWERTAQITTDLGLRGWGFRGYPERMDQSAPELPADDPDTLVRAVEGARRGVVTHITIKGERVGVIVSESTLAMSQLLAALLTSEMAVSALPAVLPTAFPWAGSLPDEHRCGI